MVRTTIFTLLAALLLAPLAAANGADLQKGSVKLSSVGPLAFGPDGILFVSDPLEATIYAVATGDTKGNPSAVKHNVSAINQKIASLLGVESNQVLIEDLAINPASGNAYLAVSRGRGPDATPVLLRVSGNGDLAEVALQDVSYAKATLPNPGSPDQEIRGGNARQQSITDLAYVDGRVFVAGLSNEEFASNLRSIPYPFEETDAGTSVEIYHGAHGAFETRSPVRTFTAYKIGNEAHLLAAYTCTPLVKFPVSQLKPGEKLRGTTIAELGNRNRPLDMFVYNKGGEDYILMANNSRGVMKITTKGIGEIEGITERVGGGGTAGLSYDTIEELKGVEQLDQLNKTSAVALVTTEDGAMNLQTIELP